MNQTDECATKRVVGYSTLLFIAAISLFYLLSGFQLNTAQELNTMCLLQRLNSLISSTGLLYPILVVRIMKARRLL